MLPVGLAFQPFLSTELVVGGGGVRRLDLVAVEKYFQHQNHSCEVFESEEHERCYCFTQLNIHLTHFSAQMVLGR